MKHIKQGTIDHVRKTITNVSILVASDYMIGKQLIPLLLYIYKVSLVQAICITVGLFFLFFLVILTIKYISLSKCVFSPNISTSVLW